MLVHQLLVCESLHLVVAEHSLGGTGGVWAGHGVGALHHLEQDVLGQALHIQGEDKEIQGRRYHTSLQKEQPHSSSFTMVGGGQSRRQILHRMSFLGKRFRFCVLIILIYTYAISVCVYVCIDHVTIIVSLADADHAHGFGGKLHFEYHFFKNNCMRPNEKY